MKSLVSVLCVLVSCSAFAKVDFKKAVNIDKVEVDGKASNFQGNVVISKDVEGKMIKIQLAPVCNPGEVCPKYIQLIQAELKSQAKNDCNSVIYTALTDARPVDGARTEIKLFDNTEDTCREIVNPVVVQATVTSARSNVTTSYLMAETQPLPAPVTTYPVNVSKINIAKAQALNLIIVNDKVIQGAKGSVQILKKDVIIKYQDENKVVQTINAVLESVEKDQCGSILYHADNGKKLGYGINLTIADNSHFICESFAQVSKITVKGDMGVVYPNAPRTRIDFAQSPFVK